MLFVFRNFAFSFFWALRTAALFVQIPLHYITTSIANAFAVDSNSFFFQKIVFLQYSPIFS